MRRFGATVQSRTGYHSGNRSEYRAEPYGVPFGKPLGVPCRAVAVNPPVWYSRALMRGTDVRLRWKERSRQHVTSSPLFDLFTSRRTSGTGKTGEFFILEAPDWVTIVPVVRAPGQEDVFPVAQFEKLWGDITWLPEAECGFFAVERRRGQQLKEPEQLDRFVLDGSRDYVASKCEFTR